MARDDQLLFVGHPGSVRSFRIEDEDPENEIGAAFGPLLSPFGKSIRRELQMLGLAVLESSGKIVVEILVDPRDFPSWRGYCAVPVDAPYGVPSVVRDADSTPSAPALRDLPAQWRASADALEQYGAPGSATALRSAADQLETALRASDDAPLTLAEAAAVSGYSEDHLARQIRKRRIPNAGKSRAPRIRAADLPRKILRIATGAAGAYDGDADARSLLARRLHHGGAHGE